MLDLGAMLLKQITGSLEHGYLHPLRAGKMYLFGVFPHRTVPGWSPSKSYDLNFKPKSSGSMCANAGRAPSGHRTVPGRCNFTLSDPAKHRMGAVEF